MRRPRQSRKLATLLGAVAGEQQHKRTSLSAYLNAERVRAPVKAGDIAGKHSVRRQRRGLGSSVPAHAEITAFNRKNSGKAAPFIHASRGPRHPVAKAAGGTRRPGMRV